MIGELVDNLPIFGYEQLYIYHYTQRKEERVARNLKMKVQASVRRRCEKCKIIKRKGIVRVICENGRHKQRQG